MGSGVAANAEDVCRYDVKYLAYGCSMLPSTAACCTMITSSLDDEWLVMDEQAKRTEIHSPHIFL